MDRLTEPVDGSGMLPEWTAGTARAEVWGFDASTLPLNATVWAPQDQGEFPLVLILHGNAQYADSELGFRYLGEQLASHGYVVAAVDESFLNTGLVDRSGGLARGDQVRSWIVLHHLAQWQRWAGTGEGPAEVRVDDVTLIGHSRGGEAVAVAAAVVQGETVGELPVVDVSGVQVTGVVAMAPTDGVIVAEKPLQLTDLNYLTIAGTHDADVNTFAGTRQYARVDPGTGGLAVAAVLHRGNHTQFNSLWGSNDAAPTGLISHVLNTGVLLDPDSQQRATSGLVTAFLNATSGGDDASRALLVEPLPAADWLPRAEVRVASAAGPAVWRESFDTLEGPVPGGGLVTDIGALAVIGQTEAAGQFLPARTGATDNQVLLINGTATAGVELSWDATPSGAVLTVDLALAEPPGSGAAPVSARVTGSDERGNELSCDFLGPIDPILSGQLGKWGSVMPLPGFEPFLHTHRVPAQCWADQGMNIQDLRSIRLEFAGLGKSGIYVDALGFTD